MNTKLKIATIFIFLAGLVAPGISMALIKPVREVLDNGMVLLLLEQHNLPMVDVNLSFKAGSAHDPENLPGVSFFASGVLTRGTQKRTANQISEEIDFIGGQLFTNVDRDFAQVTLKTLKKDFPTGLDLLMDVLLHPTFPAEEIERRRKETLAGIMSQKDDPHSVASKALNKLVFGPHPYSRPSEGTEQSVPQIQREHLEEFYQKYYRPGNAVMIVVGDITLPELKTKLNPYLTEWASKPVQIAKPVEAPAPGAVQRELIEQPLTQATILLGHLGISRSNPDYYAAYVMNYILGGGGFASRLVTRIRDNMGLVYSIASYYNTNLYPGSFQVMAQTKNESAQQVIQGTLEEMEKMRSQPVTEKELADAKSYITGSFPLKLDTNNKLASYLLYMENFGLGMDYLEKFPEYINAVTQEQVLQAARKYLQPEKYSLVVVGNQAKTGLKQ